MTTDDARQIACEAYVYGYADRRVCSLLADDRDTRNGPQEVNELPADRLFLFGNEIEGGLQA